MELAKIQRHALVALSVLVPVESRSFSDGNNGGIDSSLETGSLAEIKLGYIVCLSF